MRVLIVEDDHTLLEALSAAIKKLIPLVEVDIAETADEIIGFMRTQSDNPNFGYSLIISDVTLVGETSGFDLWRTCMQLLPDTPFMFISGISTVEFLKQVENDPNCPPFLCKPFAMQEFRDLVKQILALE